MPIHHPHTCPRHINKKKKRGLLAPYSSLTTLYQLVFSHFTTHKTSTNPLKLFNFYPSKYSTHTISTQNKLKNALMSSIFISCQTMLYQNIFLFHIFLTIYLLTKLFPNDIISPVQNKVTASKKRQHILGLKKQ